MSRVEEFRWKKEAIIWKARYDTLSEIFEIHTGIQAPYANRGYQSSAKPKKKPIRNNLGFKLIDGGGKLEEQGPFAN